MALRHLRSACYGCKLCALACSFHRTGRFGLADSYIQVERDFETSEVNWTLDSACDGCPGEPEPLCVVSCPYWALKERSKADEQHV